MTTVVTLRLSDPTAERLRSYARRTGRSVSELGARTIEEWLRQQEFADIEFRSFGEERHACLKGALQVWQVVMVARGYGLDPDQTAAYFQWPRRRAQAALNYYRAYLEEIDRVIVENDAIGFEEIRRLLPHVELLTVSLADADDMPST